MVALHQQLPDLHDAPVHTNAAERVPRHFGGPTTHQQSVVALQRSGCATCCKRFRFDGFGRPPGSASTCKGCIMGSQQGCQLTVCERIEPSWPQPPRVFESAACRDRTSTSSEAVRCSASNLANFVFCATVEKISPKRTLYQKMNLGTPRPLYYKAIRREDSD